jgi:hypothetical protein
VAERAASGGFESGPLATILGGALSRGQHGVRCLLEGGDEGGNVLVGVELEERICFAAQRVRDPAELSAPAPEASKVVVRDQPNVESATLRPIGLRRFAPANNVR